MQRYIVVRIAQSLVALLILTVIVFSLDRIAGNPLDVLLPLEATVEDAERVKAAWGLDRPLHIQYFKSWATPSPAISANPSNAATYRQ